MKAIRAVWLPALLVIWFIIGVQYNAGSGLFLLATLVLIFAGIVGYRITEK